MKTRNILVILLSSLLMLGLLLTFSLFITSMNPDVNINENAKLRIKISEIPTNGAILKTWGFYKVFIVNKKKPTPFLMPYYEGLYYLPDVTWKRATVPCETFVLKNDIFSCTDKKLPEGWIKNAKWSIKGKSLSSWLPNLQIAPFKIEGTYIVISPEYK